MRRGGGSSRGYKGYKGYTSDRRVNGLRDCRVCVSRTIVIGRTIIIVIVRTIVIVIVRTIVIVIIIVIAIVSGSACTSRGVGGDTGHCEGSSGSVGQWALHRRVKPTNAVLEGHIAHTVPQVVRHSTDTRECGSSAEVRALALVSSHISGETLKQVQNEKKNVNKQSRESSHHKQTINKP